MAYVSLRARLRDMLDEVKLLEQIAQESNRDRFIKDVRLRHIVERAVEIISEASRHLPEDFKAQHAEIPWSNIAIVGNILRHEYYRVDPQILWDVLTKRLAPLRAALEALDNAVSRSGPVREDKS